MRPNLQFTFTEKILTWSHSLKKSLMENFIFRLVGCPLNVLCTFNIHRVWRGPVICHLAQFFIFSRHILTRIVIFKLQPKFLLLGLLPCRHWIRKYLKKKLANVSLYEKINNTNVTWIFLFRSIYSHLCKALLFRKLPEEGCL